MQIAILFCNILWIQILEIDLSQCPDGILWQIIRYYFHFSSVIWFILSSHQIPNTVSEYTVIFYGSKEQIGIILNSKIRNMKMILVLTDCYNQKLLKAFHLMHKKNELQFWTFFVLRTKGGIVVSHLIFASSRSVNIKNHSKFNDP